eukprot:CAMPEP_0113693080 /NCGR_PEP_ID=MMETSP0038_2-20120614/19464_1 /TAXON_ID=2898 /ORGANISM="Cryptomonas paramecium" /LENGTH=194 /DNA_ID=CAMNT_0000615109 /DNA_START=63 /DNA_END=644 /DNA_ORIENTATION=+ /assembly_acc=CAM_ASM_000170
MVIVCEKHDWVSRMTNDGALSRFVKWDAITLRGGGGCLSVGSLDRYYEYRKRQKMIRLPKELKLNLGDCDDSLVYREETLSDVTNSSAQPVNVPVPACAEDEIEPADEYPTLQDAAEKSREATKTEVKTFRPVPRTSAHFRTLSPTPKMRESDGSEPPLSIPPQPAPCATEGGAWSDPWSDVDVDAAAAAEERV